MRIALLGSASSSLPKAPFQNDMSAAWAQGKMPSAARAHAQMSGNWDIWGCSPGCWAVAPRFTRFFEVHRWEPGQPWFTPEYCQFLRDFKGPLYVGGRIPELPHAIVYPIDAMEEKFASYFFTSSLALMLAVAIDTIEKLRVMRADVKAGRPLTAAFHPLEQPSEEELTKDDSDDIIGMWGVDMAAHEEYAYQRPGCQFFLLEAHRRGIGIYLPPESDLMRPMPVYGISEWDHNYIKLTTRAREITGVINTAAAQAKEASERIAAAQGELSALNAFTNTWTTPYGMEHGMVIRHAPGTGLGSGITHVDARPVSRMVLNDPPPPAPEPERAPQVPPAKRGPKRKR